MGSLGYIGGLLSMAVMKVAIANIVSGALYGYIIGYVAVYLTMNSLNQNCTKLETDTACNSVKHGKCAWLANPNMPSVGVCIFTDAICDGPDVREKEDACKDRDHCFWNYASKLCEHSIGFTSTQTGIFAGAMTVGAVFGSFGSGPLANKIGRRWGFVFFGFVGLVASIILHIGRSIDAYAMHVIGRLLIGVTDGSMCVIGPMYIFEMCPKEYLGPVSVYFQVFCTLGIFGAALVGLCIEPINVRIKRTNEVRIQVLVLVQTILCVLMMIVGFGIKESVAVTQRAETEANEKENNAGQSASLMSYKGPLTIATFMAFANQLTGMNAIMNYAPMMTGALGLRPMLGNFIIMLWNFVTTFASIPISAKVSFRNMYLGGIASGLVALIIVAIVITPGAASDNVRTGVGFFGILLFVLCFEVGIGPPFFLLAQQLFPKCVRAQGTSYTMGWVFIFNIIINVCFPIAVNGISGGPSGNQNVGMCAVFYFFAFVATLCLLVLYKFLYPYPEEEEAAAPAAEE